MEATAERVCGRDHRYNGWSNYETWAAKLWMDNEEPSYRYWREQTRRRYNGATVQHPFSQRERAQFTLSEQLKAEHEEAMPELPASIFSDLLSAAFSEINWYEIAESLIGDFLEEQD